MNSYFFFCFLAHEPLPTFRRLWLSLYLPSLWLSLSFSCHLFSLLCSLFLCCCVFSLVFTLSLDIFPFVFLSLLSSSSYWLAFHSTMLLRRILLFSRRLPRSFYHRVLHRNSPSLSFLLPMARYTQILSMRRCPRYWGSSRTLLRPKRRTSSFG